MLDGVLAMEEKGGTNVLQKVQADDCFEGYEFGEWFAGFCYSACGLVEFEDGENSHCSADH